MISYRSRCRVPRHVQRPTAGVLALAAQMHHYAALPERRVHVDGADAAVARRLRGGREEAHPGRAAALPNLDGIELDVVGDIIAAVPPESSSPRTRLSRASTQMSAETAGSSAPTTTSTRRSPAACRRRRYARDFGEILEQLWWRLDSALDLDVLRASARLGAVEALARRDDRHRRPPREPQRDPGQPRRDRRRLRRARRPRRVRYGATDRHGADGARRGLAENERFLHAEAVGLVGVHAAFTCTDDTLAAAAAWPPTSASACTSTSPRARRTLQRASVSPGWRPTTGCSCTASVSTGRCPAPSPTTRAAT